MKFSQAVAAPADGARCKMTQEPAGAANRWCIHMCVWVRVCVDPWLHNYKPLSGEHQECSWWPKQWPHQWHHTRWGSASGSEAKQEAVIEYMQEPECVWAIFICVYAYLKSVGSCALQSEHWNRCVCVCLCTNSCFSLHQRLGSHYSTVKQLV